MTGRFVPAALFACLLALLACLAAPKSVDAQPNIDHSGIECIAPGKFAVILSGIEPERDVRTAKVYFRSNLYPDYYYVEMTYDNGRFAGVLPQPSPETTRVIYYLEAIDGVFNGTRSVEWDPLVEDCDDDPAAAYFTGEEASIVVGATTSGQAAIPAGFSAAGIVGTIAATGIASGVGGGVGAGTAVAVGAVAAGAAGAAVVATGPSEEPTSSIVASAPPAPTTSAPASPDPAPASTSVPLPGSTTTAGSTTTVSGGTTSTGSTTTVSGSTTTSAGGASTSTSSVTTTTIVSTTTIVTTTIATTSVALPPLDASCFTVQVLGDCRVQVDASCVDPPVDRYEWVLDVDDRWQRINISSGPSSLVQDWSSSCDEDNETIRFRLTVHRGADSDTASKTIVVPGNDLKTIPDARAPRARFESHLELPVLSRARVVINGASARIVESSEPTVVDAPGPSGENVVTGTLLRNPGEPGTWRFDFRNEPRFEPGSLRATRGDVLSIGPKAVVFALTGHAAESVEFTYELRR